MHLRLVHDGRYHQTLNILHGYFNADDAEKVKSSMRKNMLDHYLRHETEHPYREMTREQTAEYLGELYQESLWRLAEDLQGEGVDDLGDIPVEWLTQLYNCAEDNTVHSADDSAENIED